MSNAAEPIVRVSSAPNSDIPIAPATAIVQLYSQYELDVVRQEHEDDLHRMQYAHNEQLRVVRNTHDKLVEDLHHAHKHALSRMQSNHAVEIGNIRYTFCRGCHKIENRVTKTGSVVADPQTKTLFDHHDYQYFCCLLLLFLIFVYVELKNWEMLQSNRP